MDLGLKGKNIVITGGSRGIGLATAQAFADEGANIGLCARTQEQVDDAVKVLSAKGVKAIGNAVDVADKEAYVSWIKACGDELGGIDVFIHNVSAGGGMEGEENWYNNFEVDLMGGMRGSEAAKPFLNKSDSPAVLYVCTTAAIETFIGPMAYNALKAALITYGQQLAQFWAGDNIRINLVSPGPIYFKNGPWDWIKNEMTELYDATLKDCPMGRMGTPEEVANAIVFLCSPKASWINGVNLVVDGAFTKRIQF
jgi:3-oxoacyl-[acyl-carrier protein] reductase